MKPSIDINHLREDSRQFQRYLVAVDIVSGKVPKIIYPCTIDEFHDEHPLGRGYYFGDIQGRIDTFKVFRRFSRVSSFVTEVQFLGKVFAHLLREPREFKLGEPSLYPTYKRVTSVWDSV